MTAGAGRGTFEPGLGNGVELQQAWGGEKHGCFPTTGGLGALNFHDAWLPFYILGLKRRGDL